MPKHDPMSAKGIANRQKTVGLQRLRWYCQMCQKQCRDENGFKCHTTSESHLRQMRVFADNPHSVLDEFSKEFERGYLETLSSLHGTKRVKANTVYQEYIADKHHIHMNATAWTTLTGFCMHLGKESKAIVDETEKGWFIQYIDRDPKVLARQAQAEQRQRFELDEEERRKREIAAQVQAAEERRRAEGGGGEGSSGAEGAVDNSLVREEGDQKIAVALAPVVTTSLGLKKRPRQDLGFGAESDDEEEAAAPAAKSSAIGGGFPGFPPSRSTTTTATGAPHISSSSSMAGGGVLARMIQEDEARKRARDNHCHQAPPAVTAAASAAANVAVSAASVKSDPHATAASRSGDKPKSAATSWLYRNLVVKVMSKEAGRGRLYKQKARVVRVLGRAYDEAEVEVEGEMHVLRLVDLETSIPKVGQAVMVVRGQAAGCEGELLAIHEAAFNCDVRVTQRGSEFCGQVLRGLEYDYVCRYSP